MRPTSMLLIVAIGGGGLISGIAVAAKALRSPRSGSSASSPRAPRPCTRASRPGHVVELAAITTRVPTMAARKTEPLNLELVQRHVEQIVLVSDDEMQDAARLLWLEHGLAVDLSGAAALALLTAGKFRPRPGEKICALICGAGTDGLD